jgi:tetratricopeptide (TPR) repeat protein
MMSRNKILTFLVLTFLTCCAIGAQTQRDWWYTLERGKQMFRQGDYGSALLTFEDARRQRRAMYERLERHLINLLSITEVRRIGDSLDLVERYIGERHHADAAEALAELYYRIPKETFNNSATAALTALGTLKDYPEAEYWIGETYLIEGELRLAQSQFQKAHDLRQLLENPGSTVELLYKIAAICRTRQEYNEMERNLLAILSDDKLWSGGGTGTSGTFEKQSLTRVLENNGVNRFLTLYRYRNTESEQAHRLLGFFYYASGRHSRAQEHLMFSFLIQNTVIIEEVIRNRYDYTFTTLEALAPEISRYPLLADYAAKNEYYKTVYYLGASLYGNGKTAAAREIWTFLSAQNAAGEWQARAAGQLRSPHVERLVEMP